MAELTREERATISRNNGGRSKGPTSETGKRIASRNSYKHGMCCEKLILPSEMPEYLQERNEFWQDWYRPQSPASFHQLDLCIHATLLSDRCELAHTSALISQTEAVADAFEEGRQQMVNQQA